MKATNKCTAIAYLSLIVLRRIGFLALLAGLTICLEKSNDAQVQFDDLRAGYLENHAKLLDGGLRIRYRSLQIDRTEGRVARHANEISYHQGVLRRSDLTDLQTRELQEYLTQLKSKEVPETQYRGAFFDIFLRRHGNWDSHCQGHWNGWRRFRQ